MKPLVSILIPAYNAEPWIADTLQSAIAQTWQRTEIIVVDDGSKDRTVEVARQFGSNRVAVVSVQNRGAAAARNYALQLSQGDYIQWLDADDLLAPDKIERQLGALREGAGKRMLLSSPWAFFYFRTHCARFVRNSLYQNLSPVEWLLRKMGENLHMQTATWLTSRDLSEAAGPWDTRLHVDDDGEYFCRVLLASEGTRFVPEARVFYRVTPSNRLSNIGASDRKKDAMLLSMKLHVQYLRSLEESERVRKACLTYLQTWFENFYPERMDIVAELQKLAIQVQGHLEVPRLDRKYAWMKPVFGWTAAKWAQRALPQLKASCIRQCDKTMYRFEAAKRPRASVWEHCEPTAENDLAKARRALGGSKRKENASRPLLNAPRQEMSRNIDIDRRDARGLPNSTVPRVAHQIAVALLTGGADRPYTFGMATALISRGAVIDLIGSDDVDCPDFHSRPGATFLNLRGDQEPSASFVEKASRVLIYYVRLIRYAATAKPRIFHILWNNKFEFFDRTLLMLYYKFLRKKIVLTLHNVNAGRRDSRDTHLNRLTLRIQYRLADHIFVHTEKMKIELIEEFSAQVDRVTVVPFGINNSVPNTDLNPSEARRRLGICEDERTILFFGHIAPYKGLEYLVFAFHQILARRENYRLIIAGRPKNCEEYWRGIRGSISEDIQKGRVMLRADFIPDEETEVYFKAADVLVLPYKYIYQSGVLFLGQSFGLPVLAADVGSLKDDIVEGKTGFVFRPEDPVDLVNAIERYFASDLYADLNSRRQEIRDYATERHSWDVVGQMTMNVYASVIGISSSAQVLNRDAPTGKRQCQS